MRIMCAKGLCWQPNPPSIIGYSPVLIIESSAARIFLNQRFA
jgi:hypothetical protein